MCFCRTTKTLSYHKDSNMKTSRIYMATCFEACCTQLRAVSQRLWCARSRATWREVPSLGLAELTRGAGRCSEACQLNLL